VQCLYQRACSYQTAGSKLWRRELALTSQGEHVDVLNMRRSVRGWDKIGDNSPKKINLIRRVS
jgi:hypothetical protein